MSEYRLGLYEKALPPGLGFPEMLGIAKESGYDFLEISIDESDERLSRLDWTPRQRQALVQAMAEQRMPIGTMCLSGHRKYPLGSRAESTRRKSVEIFEKAVVLACDLGIRIIQLAGYDVYYEQGGADTRAFFLENLANCVDFAAKHGVMLGFETMETPFMDTVSKAMEVVREIDSPYLGVYPDLGNLTNAAVLYDADLFKDIAAGQGKVIAMHLKETEPGKYRDMDYGQGHVDFAGGAEIAVRLGVRMFVTEFWHDPENAGDGRIREACAYMRKVLDSVFCKKRMHDSF